jgi:serpin B
MKMGQKGLSTMVIVGIVVTIVVVGVTLPALILLQPREELAPGGPTTTQTMPPTTTSTTPTTTTTTPTTTPTTTTTHTTTTPTTTPTTTTAPTTTPSPLVEEFFCSELKRENSPNVSQEDLAALTNGNSEFALDLYQELRDIDSNLFFSPYSISLALVMTYAGAKGDTAQQMADTLHFTLPQERLHPAFNALDLALTGQSGENEENFKFNIANSMWGQVGINFNSEFLDVLALNYGAGMRLLNFQQDPEAARIRINNWVSEQTENKITDLIPKWGIDTLTTLVLTNAIYFKATWEYAFPEDWTRDGTFTLLNNTQVTVSMMSWVSGEVVRYAEGDGYQAVELPYKGTSMSMLIILPALDRFEEFENMLTAECVNEIAENLRRSFVNVRMPKFKFETSLKLTDTLAEMGMPIAFTPQADFSGITTDRPLPIDQVLHKAFVSVDENGTEAAAATVVILTFGFPPQPTTVSIDHPFIFLIRDTNTGTILFLGRVLDPTS